MHDYKVLCLCILIYVYICGCTRGCMHVWRACMGTCVSVLWVCVDSPSSLCVRLRVVTFRIRSVRSRLIARDLGPIWIYVHYGPDTLVIQISIHGMIRRSLPVHAVRPDDDSVPKLRHFMSMFVLMSFFVYRCQYVFVFYFYHFMWLFDVFYQCDYLYHFMRHQWAFTFM